MAETKKVAQQMRYSDEELSIIKNTFCENDELLKALRKVIFQGVLNDEEVKMIRAFNMQHGGVHVLRKTILPEIDLDAPFFQMVDLYVNIDTKEATIEKAYPMAVARDIVSEYLEQQLGILTGENKEKDNKIIFNKLHSTRGKDIETAFTELSARNTLLQHVDFQLMQLKMLAGNKDETIEQTKLRLQKNSNK